MVESDFHLDGGLDADEEHYFKTGGDVTDGLAKTAPAGAPAPQEPAAPTDRAAPAATPAAAAAPGPEEPGDDPVIPGEDLPRRISRNKFLAEQTRARDLERQLNDKAIAQARLEERLNLITQAMQPAQQEQGPADEAWPDPNQDIFAFIQRLKTNQDRINQEIADYRQQIEVGQQEMTEQTRYINSMNRYAATQPNFVESYAFLIRNRAAELMAPRYPQATYEQLMGAEIPDDIAEMIRQEERDLYKNAFQNERNPAAEIYRMAQLRGWRPSAAPQQEPQSAPQPQGGAAQPTRPGTALGAQPAAPARQNGAAPTATSLVDAIKRGQPAAQSLGNVSGSAVPPTPSEITPESLASMSDEEFAVLFNRLQNSGNQTELRRLFGN